MRNTLLSIVLSVSSLVGCGEATDTGAESASSSGDALNLNSNLRILGFSLYNADTGNVIAGYETVATDAKIVLDTLPTRNLAVVANTSSNVASIVFDYNGKKGYRIDSSSPFTLFGDTATGMTGVELKVGTHTIKATAFGSKYGKGTLGTNRTIKVNVVESSDETPPPVTAPTGPIPLATSRVTYVMQAIDSENVNATTLAKASGIVIRTKWSTVEPNPGQFNLTWLKAQIARAKNAGKLIQLEVLSGDDSPAWLAAQGAVIWKYSAGQIPLPWDNVFQQRYAMMIKHLSTNLDWSNITHFHSIGADNAEWHYNQFDNGAFYQVAGYSDQKMLDAHVRAVGTLVQTLPKVVIVCDIGDHSRAWTSQTIAALKSKYKGHVGFQMDSLKADTSTTYAGFTRIQTAAAEGHHAGFEMVGPSMTNDGAPVDRFGGSFEESIAKANLTKAQWMIVYQVDL